MHLIMGFYVNILNGGFWRTCFKTHRSRIGWRPSSFLGTMTKGCKTPKPSLLEGLARLYPLSIGQQSPWDLQEEWEVCGNWPGGEALTLILRLPRALVDSSLFCSAAETMAALWSRFSLLTGMGEKRDCRAAMVLCLRWMYRLSTNAASACWMPRHGRQRSWLSMEDRKCPQPRGHRLNGVFNNTQAVLDYKLHF